MNPVTNPFAPGAGFPPPELAGRDELLEMIRIAVERTRLNYPAKSVLMVGLRGAAPTARYVDRRRPAAATRANGPGQFRQNGLVNSHSNAEVMSPDQQIDRASCLSGRNLLPSCCSQEESKCSKRADAFDLCHASRDAFIAEQEVRLAAEGKR